MSEKGCTAIVVTGDKVEGPNTDYDWAILAKTSDTNNTPAEYAIHVAAKVGYNITYMTGPNFPADQTTDPFNTYAYTGAQSSRIGGVPDGPAGFYRVAWGINEAGLAVIYTLMSGMNTHVDGEVVADGGNTQSTFKTNLTSSVTDYYKDRYITFTGGANSGEIQQISAYNGTTKFITVSNPFSNIPSGGDTFEIYNEEWGSEMFAGYPNTNGLQSRGRDLLTLILALYDDVDDIVADLVDQTKVIGPENRYNTDSLLIIDRNGDGVIIEVSPKKAIYYRVTDDYFAENNVMRIWEEYYADVGAWGGVIPNTTKIVGEDDCGIRTGYIVNIYHELINANGGQLDYKDAVKYLIRYVNHKEEGDDDFYDEISTYWEINNDGTYSSMVAVTGDTRYDGRLNCLWGAYGNPPMLGVHLPHIPYAGALPDNGTGTWSGYPPYTDINDFVLTNVRPYAGTFTGGMWLYDPALVREVQEYARVIEDYTFEQWENMLDTIAGGLGDAAQAVILNALVDATQITGTAAYHAGAMPNLVTYASEPTAQTGVTAQHLPYSTPIVDEMTIPVVDGATLSLSVPATPNIDTSVQCTLTVNIVGPTVGGQACSVTLSPVGGSYNPGTVVSMTPVPGSFYQFHSWEGDLAGDVVPGSITMDKDRTVTCNFEYMVYPHTTKEAFWGAVPGNETYGIRVTATWPTGGNGLDGLSTVAAENPYLTPYFFHGALLADFPVLDLHSGTGLYIQNCIVDDDAYAGANAAIAIGIDDAIVTGCTLNNCVRYGITTQGADNFYIGYNTVNRAQYCVSGSSGYSSNGIVEHNNLRGMTLNAIKCKWWDTVIVRHNFIDLTPSAGVYGTIAFEFSDDNPNRDVTIEHNSVIHRADGGFPLISGMCVHADPGPCGGSTNNDSSTWSPPYAPLPNYEISTRNVVQNNVFYNVNYLWNLEGNPETYTIYDNGTPYIVDGSGAPADYDYTIQNNTFVNCGVFSPDSGFNNLITGNIDENGSPVP